MQANNSSVLSFLDRNIRPPLKHESLYLINKWLMNTPYEIVMDFQTLFLVYLWEFHQSSLNWVTIFLFYWCFCPLLWITAQIEWSISPLRVNRFTDPWAEVLIALLSFTFSVCISFWNFHQISEWIPHHFSISRAQQ